MLNQLPATVLILIRVSGLWQSFLKELPGSLLVSDLYDDWMAALDSEDHQQRVVEIARYASSCSYFASWLVCDSLSSDYRIKMEILIMAERKTGDILRGIWQKCPHVYLIVNLLLSLVCIWQAKAEKKHASLLSSVCSPFSKQPFCILLPG